MRVKDLFIKFKDDIDSVTNIIVSKLSYTNNRVEEYKKFYSDILARISNVKNNNYIVITIGENLHSNNFIIDSLLVKPGNAKFLALEATDWDIILGAHVTTEFPPKETLASIIYFMTLISFDESERDIILQILKGE